MQLLDQSGRKKEEEEEKARIRIEKNKLFDILKQLMSEEKRMEKRQ